MPGYVIDLNLYGPFKDLDDLIKEARSTDESGLVYFAVKKGSNPKGCDISYIGINQQKDKGSRYVNHHKLKLHPQASVFNSLWVGYLYRLNEPFQSGHSARLKLAEDILISWFLPPYNTQGISRATGTTIGTGAYYSGKINFHWWTLSETPRARAGIAGFPKSLTYSRDSAVDTRHDWITAEF